ncbi:hypothetical protein E2C01_021554 [Portunus trituberculatus]|uniref:Uncharacterized protein n=1 Tax=Portunus trituberculatus TaxID=210409 RepID=A0A5B7E2V4_PORTR|nr:hypothetical protein [Portunus trituberculatus]
MSGTDSVSIVNFKRRLDKFMDWDDRWNKIAFLIQGPPCVGLTASCRFPLFL